MPTYLDKNSGDIIICSEAYKHPFKLEDGQYIVAICFKKEGERFYLDANALSGLAQYVEYLQKQNFKPSLKESTN